MTWTRFTAVLTAAALFTGCQANLAQRQHIPSEVEVDKPIKGRPTLGMPIQLPESNSFVVPFTIDRPKRWLEDADQFQTSKQSAAPSASTRHYEYEQTYTRPGLTRHVRWHNAIVGSEAGEGRLVLDRKGIISKLDIVGPWVEIEDPDRGENEPIEWRFVPKATLMLATVEDSDGDGQLTNRDANVLIAGDPDAAGLHPITPAGTQVNSMLYNASLNRVLIMVTQDTNADGLFTAADSAAPYVYVPGERGMAKQMVDPRLTDQAERLLK